MINHTGNTNSSFSASDVTHHVILYSPITVLSFGNYTSGKKLTHFSSEKDQRLVLRGKVERSGAVQTREEMATRRVTVFKVHKRLLQRRKGMSRFCMLILGRSNSNGLNLQQGRYREHSVKLRITKP